MITCDFCGKGCSDDHSDTKIEAYRWTWAGYHYKPYKTLHLHRWCYDTIIDIVNKGKIEGTSVKIKSSDLEIRIREEVTELINEITDRASKSHTFGDRECFDNLLNKADRVKDRLNLLWGKDNE